MSAKPLVLRGPHGRIEIDPAALESVAVVALRRVTGAELARGRHGVALGAEADRVDVGLQLTARAGEPLHELGADVQRVVAAALGATTGLPVGVDVTFVGLTT